MQYKSNCNSVQNNIRVFFLVLTDPRIDLYVHAGYLLIFSNYDLNLFVKVYIREPTNVTITIPFRYRQKRTDYPTRDVHCIIFQLCK
jgi:hypothetical protein